MKATVINCKNCNAPLEIEEGMKKCYCKYCGTCNIIDDGTININLREEYHIYDEAKILQLRMEEEERKINKEEALRLKEQLEEKRNRQRNQFDIWKKKRIVFILLGTALYIASSIGNAKLNNSEGFGLFSILSLISYIVIPIFVALTRPPQVNDIYPLWKRRILAGLVCSLLIVLFGMICNEILL